MRTIEITVDPQGQARVETRGFSGPSCREASRFLERALGRVAADTPTAEHFQQAAGEERLLQSS